MAGSLSIWAMNKILEHSVSKTTWTKPAYAYIALYSTTPSSTNTVGVEISSGKGYSRQTTTWGTASMGSISNEEEIFFGPATQDWGTITGVAIVDESSNVIWSGEFTSERQIVIGESLVFAKNSLVLSLA